MGEAARRRATAGLPWALGATALAVVVSLVQRRPHHGAPSPDMGPDPLQVFVHEFRTPVASLGSLTRALRDDGALDDQRRREALELVQQHTEHLAEMLEDVRRFSSRLSAGARATVTDPLVLGAVGTRTDEIDLRALVLAAAAASGLSSARLRVHVAPDLGPVVTDPVRLRRIVTNLLENALRHGDADAPVLVHWSRTPTGARLSISNTAPGPFARRRGGLGMPMVASLATSMGGRVRHERRRGRHLVEFDLPACART